MSFIHHTHSPFYTKSTREDQELLTNFQIQTLPTFTQHDTSHHHHTKTYI